MAMLEKPVVSSPARLVEEEEVSERIHSCLAAAAVGSISSLAPGGPPKLMAACCFGREAETDLSRAIRHSHLPFIHKRLFLALVRMINITVSLFSPVELSTDDTDSLTAKLSHALLLTWTS